MSEQVFFDQAGVRVTSTLVKFPSGKTYATANITSVSTEKIVKQSGCCLFAIFSLFTKTHWELKIASAAGETQGMVSTDQQLIEAVSTAIMQAIAARG